jgi:hypothetical protein
MLLKEREGDLSFFRMIQNRGRIALRDWEFIFRRGLKAFVRDID